ncbi:MAG TPA: lantibiotic dehydratase [Mycobacteriales bacterium]
MAFRAPLLPFATVGSLTGGAAREAWASGDDLDAAVARDRAHLDAAVRRIVADDVVRAAVALASPDLDDALSRDEGAPAPRGLVGYLLRMAGRPVPFGLFASCGSGSVEGAPAYALAAGLRVRARLDLGAADLLLSRTEAAAYVPNSTLHTAAGRLRLVERVPAGASVAYHPLAVEEDEAVRAVLDAAGGGASLDDLARVLVGEEVAFADAAAFVRELVAAQLLVPAVPLVTGEPLPRVAAGPLRALAEAPSAATVRAAVAAVRAETGAPRDRAVHVDAARPGTFVLGDEVLAEAYRAVDLLHRLQRETALDGELAAFADAYAARYGDAETPLLEVLDQERGIGFGAPPAAAVAGAPLLRGFNPAPSTDGPPWTPIDHHLVDLLSRTLRAGAIELEPPGHELHSLRNQRPKPLPPSMALRATIAARSAEAVAAGEFRLVVHEVTGPNAVAAFSRFAPLDEGLDALARRHVAAEEERADVTFAEVVHLPERRAGNVAARPALRGTEIPVLAAPAAPRAIPPGDLTVSVVDGRTVLRDQSGREVLPRLSAPHTWLASPLPLYRFLGAVQEHGVAADLRWSWGSVESAPFLPRVVVGRLVLSRARWRWFSMELRPLTRARTTAERYAALQRLRERWAVPRWVTLGAQELPLDLDGIAAADLLAYEARRANQVTVRELLPGPDELCLAGPGGAYVHDFVLPLHGPPPIVAASSRRAPPAPAVVPGGEWLAATLVTGPATADAVLRDVVAPLVAGAGEWWYDRAPHPRLRVRGDAAALLAALRERVAPLVADGRVADVRVETYRPAPADAVAHADSVAALRVVLGGDDLDARWRAAFWGVDRLLADAGLDVAARAAAVRAWRDRLGADLGESGSRALRLAGRVHRARRGDLREPDAALAALLDERSGAVAPVLRGAPAGLLEAACAAHLARLLRAAHDVQRLVVYDLLERRYRATGTS